ncbi:MAG: ribulose phosphate epimerase [Rhodobacterales bacterium]|nr:MAG: ribulose phosphate epimerase [Rhodobacterales bacterium]
MADPARDTARQALRRRARGISAGLFAAPLDRLGETVAAMAAWPAGIVHFDIMDGVFVPQITGGPGFVAALGGGMLRDVHLMVADPAAHVDSFADAGADLITVHAEAPGAGAALAAVRAASDRLARPILAGLAVMPATPVGSLAPLLDPLPDCITLLALDPRDGAAPDLDSAGERLEALRKMLAPARPLFAIDGGVTAATIESAVRSGPDMVVSGSAIFRAEDPGAAFGALARVWADRAPANAPSQAAAETAHG